MPLILAYDTETTGLPLFDQPSDDPRQPHIVEIAIGLFDEATGAEVDRYHTIVRPDGWTIPDDVAAIHGITTERALAEGIDERDALFALLALWRRAEFRIAHNEGFDARIARIGAKRFFGEGVADEWKAGRAECTQRLATPILKLPPTEKMRAAKRFHHKSANLTECVRHFFDEDHAGAHGALPDMLACARVWFAIKGRAPQAPAEPPPIVQPFAVNPAGAAATADELGF